MTAVTVTGERELSRLFDRLGKTVGNKIARPAIAKASSYAAKKIKASIPSRYKGIRRAIGWRNLKTKFNKGLVGTKIGAGVGKQSKKKTEKNAATRKDRGSRRGVGFDASNIHWWFLGTGERETGTKRKRTGGKRGRGGWRGNLIRIATGKKRKKTGRMPPQSRPIDVILRGEKNEMTSIIRTWINVGIKKEAAKK